MILTINLQKFCKNFTKSIAKFLAKMCLYQLDCAAEPPEMVTPASAPQQGNHLDTWQDPLGHECEKRVKNMAYGELATGIRLLKRFQFLFCKACIAEKTQRKPFSHLAEWLVHTGWYILTYVLK